MFQVHDAVKFQSELCKTATDNRAAELETAIQELLQLGEKPDFVTWCLKRALQGAVTVGAVDSTEVILRQVPDIQEQWLEDESNQPPLMLAGEAGHVGIVKLLLDHGAKVNFHDLEGRTTLHWASMNGHLEVVKVLIQQGANVNHQGKLSKYTPLALASRQGHPEVVQHLLQNGADPNLRDIHQETALFDAVRNGQCKCTEILLQNGAHVNMTDKVTGPGHMQHIHEEAALFDSVRYAQYHCTELLLRNGAHVNMVAKEGCTPLMVAILWNRPKALALLAHYNCDANIPGNCNYPKHTGTARYPLEIAVMENKLDLAEMLLCAGATRQVLWKENFPTVLTFDEETNAALSSWVHQQRLIIPSLMSLCRDCIRSSLGAMNFHSKLKQLNMPSVIQDYLLLKELLLR